MKCKWNTCGLCHAPPFDELSVESNNDTHDGECLGSDECDLYKLWRKDQDMLDTTQPCDVPKVGNTKPNVVIPDSGKRQEFASGSVRDTDEGKIKWSLMPPMLWPLNDVVLELGFVVERYLDSGDVTVLEEFLVDAMDSDSLRQSIASRFEGGAVKYDPYNWCKGQNVCRMLDSLGRHLWECQVNCENDTSEDHMGAVLWNMCAIAWTTRNRKDLNDFAGWDAYAKSGLNTEQESN